MKFRTLVLSTLVAFSGAQVWAQTNTLTSVGIVTGTVTLTDRVGTPTNQPGTVGNNLAGLAYVAGNVPGAVDTSVSFFTLTGATLPPNPANTFTSYGTLISPTAVGSYPDVAALATANSYSGLTFAIDDLGLPIAGTFYMIHHKNSGDYFANIVPRTGGLSSTSDLKPMSWQGGVAGGPSDPGAAGYFGLAYATGAVSGYSANSMFYLRTDGASHTQFGEMIPALTGASTDKIDLTTAVGSFGAGGYTTLAYSPVAFGGYAANQFYYLRLDSITGNTILGRLDPSLVPGTRTISDIANLGGVFNTLNYAFDATGPAGSWGLSQLYATGGRSATAQSISFAAIADKLVGAPFTVTPSASSGLVLTLTLVPSSTGSASITGPVAGVFTVKPLSPGVITLEAKQSGGAFDTNLLRQSFNATGTAVLSITTQPTSQIAATGSTANFSVVASGTAPLSYQWRKAGIAIAGATSATLALANVAAGDAANYDVVVTNGSLDTLASNVVTLTVTAAAPIITNSPLTAGATVGTAFNFTITASGTPTSYAASPLPAGLTVNTTTGAITGTPTAPGTTSVLLGATNGGGTGNATLTITVAAAGVAPNITNSPLTAGGTVGTAFNFAITATGSPTSYAASPLPAGLTINTTTGAITGTPTAAATTAVVLGATNAFGTDNATLTITIGAAGVAPNITNSPLTAAGTVGTPFGFTITATGTPTSFAASPLPAGLAINTTTGAITGTPTTAATTTVVLGATNAFGTDNATLTITVAAAGLAPVITNSPLTAGGTIGTPFSFTITATGTPTSYAASPLPAGLVRNTTTGAITGTPTTAGTTAVVLGATNAFGTGNATLSITVAAAGVAPIITNSPLTVAGTVGTPFGFTITATGSPLSYAASPLPAGLVRNTTTGAITGTPTAVGTTPVLLGATNTFGTGNATLTIVVAAAGTTPVIANNPVVAAGTVGVPFSFAISATGLPTSYAANVLPAGLTLNTVTGVITGTPAADGVTAVLLSATNAFGTGRTSDLTITIAPAGSAPSITNRPLTAAGTVGAPFAFTIVASGSPTSYTATPLPAGLSLVAATGAITGRPAVAGTTVVLLGATNSTGTGTAALTITVGAAGVVPVITSPSTAPGTVGSPITTYLIEATGLPTSYSATGLPPGLTLDPLTGAISGTPTTAGTYLVTITATNSAGSSSTTVTMIIAGAAVAPVFTGPATATGAAGTPFVTYFIAATGLPTSYTATGLPPGLSLNALTGAINGTPTSPGTYGVTITATNAYGTSTTTLVISLTPNLSSRITNFAARAISGPGDQTLIMGFVVSGDNKNILVRGIGPTLSAFGITNPLADPLLTLFDNTGAVATNDDWSTTSTGQSQSATIGATAARVGAFALPADSKDSSLLFTVNNGAHTTGLLRPNSTTGVALTEIYDLDTVLGSRLVNVSARMNVTGGEGTLIAGFSIAGTVPKQVLIRGVGPALAQFGVSGVLADPMIAVYSGSTQIYSNDNWEAGTSTAAQISAAAAQVGAFALPAGSKDAVLLVTLQPGNYTVLVSGGTATGVALIEIYDTQ